MFYKADVLSALFHTFAAMLRRLTTIVLGMLAVTAAAQKDQPKPEDRQVDMDAPTFVPMVRVGKVLDQGDSILYMEMSNVYVYPPVEFTSQRQQAAYMRLVKNVKKVLPIAKEVRQILLETGEYLETLPDKKSRDAHIKRVEEDLVKEYKPRMKKLTFSQGKLLIKLVDRECHSTAYEAMQAFIGPFRSGIWQAFAWAFGASLKKGYDAQGTDRLTERVVLMVEAGQL